MRGRGNSIKKPKIGGGGKISKRLRGEEKKTQAEKEVIIQK